MATERLRRDMAGPWVASGAVISKSRAGRKAVPPSIHANTRLRGDEPRRYKALTFHQELVMAVERTLSIIKPDATRRNLTGEIVSRFEKAGLRIVAQRRMRLSRAQAEAFYAVHRERPFFTGLVEFMISGPVVVQVLEGEGAV